MKLQDKIIVKRYAEALVAFAKDTGGLERVLKDLKSLRRAINDTPQLLDFLKSQEFSLLEKHHFIEEALKHYSQELREFLRLLLQKARINELPDIIEYVRIAYSYGEETEALLKTSFPLDLDLVKAIQKRLEDKFKKKFKFYLDLDGSLLGGVQVVIGNTIIDGSIRRRLDELKEKLLAIKV